MKSLISTASIILLSLMVPGAQAGYVLLTESTLAALTTQDPVGGGIPLVTDMTDGTLRAHVISQVYPADSGGHVYFYQVDNTTPGSSSSVELLTLTSFIGAGGNPAMGGSPMTFPPAS